MSERGRSSSEDNAAGDPEDTYRGDASPETRGLVPMVADEPEASWTLARSGLDAAKLQIEGLGKSLAAMMLQQAGGRPSAPIAALDGAFPRDPRAATSRVELPGTRTEGPAIATGQDPTAAWSSAERLLPPDSAREPASDADPERAGRDASRGGPGERAAAPEVAERPAPARSGSLTPVVPMPDMTMRGVGGEVAHLADAPRSDPRDEGSAIALDGISARRSSEGVEAGPGGVSPPTAPASLAAPSTIRPEGQGEAGQIATYRAPSARLDVQDLRGALEVDRGSGSMGRSPDGSGGGSWPQGASKPNQGPMAPNPVSAVVGGISREFADLWRGASPPSVPGSAGDVGEFPAGFGMPGDRVVRDMSPLAGGVDLPDPSGRGGPPMDLSRTNQLLQQLLDEVKRGRQGFSAGAARIVAPER